MFKFLMRIIFFGLFSLFGLLAWEYQKENMLREQYGEHPQSISEFVVSALKEEISGIKEELTAIEKTASETYKDSESKINDDMINPETRFSSIDQYARNPRQSDEMTIKSLAQYLNKGATTDLEKARAIYVWIAENIRYDDVAFNSKKYENYTAEFVLKNRKAVCEGFSNLYLALGNEMNLEVKKISGYSKGYGYKKGKKLTKADHAWNAIKIDGEWGIVDATWGGGFGKSVSGKLVTSKKFNGYWFNVNPYEAIFNHFPEGEQLSFVTPSISLSDYEKMPNLKGAFFDLGFSGKKTFKEAYLNSNFEAPTSYNHDTYVRVINAPSHGTLMIDESYDFEFYVPDGLKLAIIESKKKWTEFKKENGKFSLRFTPKTRGDLNIGVQHSKSNGSFEFILKYKVKKGKKLRL